MRFLALPVLFACAYGTAFSQNFQLIATQTPPGSNPSDWKSVLRFDVASTYGAATPLTDIPAAQVADPASPAFRTGSELFIGNRHGNQGPGSVSRFILHPDQTFTKTGDITGNGLSRVHQICFNPVTGELFAANRDDGISRFIFDSNGNAIPHGHHQIGITRGVMVGRDGETMYVTRATNAIDRYRLNANGTITFLSSMTPPGASSLHFMRIRSDGELYAADVWADRVYRYRFDALNNPVYVGSLASPSAIDVTFSPDAQEMFVSSHFSGGITRYSYDSGSDSWSSFAVLPTISLGGIAIYQVVDLPAGTVAGNIDLQAFFGAVAGRQTTLELLHPVTGVTLHTAVVSLDAGGNYSFTTALRGEFRVAAKASHWLRRARPDTIVLDNDAGAGGVNLSLKNGDVDDDNEVTIGDYAQISSAFGSEPGDGNWNPEADLNGDDGVDIGDFAILSSNFGDVGD
ncbi:MAG TPA: hypothetical protein PLL78_12180 [Fimbriimonadaceae bacterium]|nr:hypothetical protein [Fimbriimonadaceae bacterium]HRJ97433.1 hypothetical protein [Fimbriimonadaceae bacterium]